MIVRISKIHFYEKVDIDKIIMFSPGFAKSVNTIV